MNISILHRVFHAVLHTVAPLVILKSIALCTLEAWTMVFLGNVDEGYKHPIA